MSGRPSHQRWLVTAILLTAVLFGATRLYAAVTGPGPRGTRIQTLASGSMSVWNSKDGAAIFNLSNIAPGVTDQGEVTIGNTGDSPGSLTVSSLDLSDSPGMYGGSLSQELDLRIVDMTSGAGAAVYAGPLASMPEKPLGVLLAGESRTYRFLVRMNNGGSPATQYTGDNVYQRATTTLGYRWTLTQSETPVEPGPPATPEGPVCPNRLIGNSRDNILNGTPGPDSISGRGGSDVIAAGLGDDCAYGSSGPDKVAGNAGNDYLRGGGGHDWIYGGPGSDVINSRDRNRSRDTVNCGDGVDTAFVDRWDSTENCEIVHR